MGVETGESEEYLADSSAGIRAPGHPVRAYQTRTHAAGTETERTGGIRDLDNPAGAKIKAEALLKGAKDKSLSYDKIKADSGKDYQGGDLLIGKTAQHAQQLGISYNDLLELFTRDIGYMSKLNETETDFQFYVVRQKYTAKMLSISDLVQPETTITVYDYIKQNLTNQMQSQALIAAVQDITKTLRTPSNFEYKQKEEKLKKLLNWDK